MSACTLYKNRLGCFNCRVVTLVAWYTGYLLYETTGHMEKQETEMKWKLEMETGNGNGNKKHTNHYSVAQSLLLYST